MNQKHIRESEAPDLAGSFAAIHRAARSARDLAIRTNTGIIIAVDGTPVRSAAAKLINCARVNNRQHKTKPTDGTLLGWIDSPAVVSTRSNINNGVHVSDLFGFCYRRCLTA